MAVQKEPRRPVDYGSSEAANGLSVFSEQFDSQFAYNGDDLGCHYEHAQTRFVLWAPTAEEAFVMLYEDDQDTEGRALPMLKEERGIWRAAADADLEGWSYTYRVRIGQQWNEAVDPYARAVRINGTRGAILNLEKTNPPGWEHDARPSIEHTLDAVIYEVHIRDLTIQPESGAHHRGTFIAAAQTGTWGPDGIATGLDHIASLGVTHVQLLPIFDYSEDSVDETNVGASYNWGYDPRNYNAPEGSYSTNPYDPAVRIRELKQLIQALHAKGLRVIMDVVYNHLYDAYRCHFSQLVPGYYFRYSDIESRTLADGSGCGNETASERAMMRKFIVESVAFWAEEYHLDGFRFDLMGLHDIATMNAVRSRLDCIDTQIIMTGEGWIMGSTLPDDQRANQHYATALRRIAQFNDSLRDAVKGSIFNPQSKGFISGQDGMEQAVKSGVAGEIAYSGDIRGYAAEPDQCLNFVECHDNHTLWDKLSLSNPQEDEATRIRMHLLATAIVLTSQGIPFLHAGQEFLRTKQGVGNSYQSPDEINQMDWIRCARYQAVADEIRGLIALRRHHSAFRMRSADAIRRHLAFEEAAPGTIAFTLRDHANGDPSRHLYVLYNPARKRVRVPLPKLGQWKTLWGLSSSVQETENGSWLDAQELSCIILHIV